MPLRRRRGSAQVGDHTVEMPGGLYQPRPAERSVHIKGWGYTLILIGMFLVCFYAGISMRSWTNGVMNDLAKWQLQRGINHTVSNLDKVTTATFNINEQYGTAGYIFDPCTNTGDPTPSESNPVGCQLSSKITKLRAADLVAANKNPGAVNPSLTVMKAEHALVNREIAAIRKSHKKLSVQELNALGYAAVASSTTPVSQVQRDNLAVNKTTQVTPCIIANPDADLKSAAGCVDRWFRIGHGYEQPSPIHISLLANKSSKDLLFGLLFAAALTFLFHVGRMRSFIGGLGRAVAPPIVTSPVQSLKDIFGFSQKKQLNPAPQDRRGG